MGTGKLRDGTKRVSYIEEIPTYKALDILAAAKDTNLSAIIREATADYLAKNDPTGELRKVSDSMAGAFSDEKSQRAGETIDDETQKTLIKIIGRIRKTK